MKENLLRREFLQVSLALGALSASPRRGVFARSYARHNIAQDDLLEFRALGNVTLIHVTDIHAQLKPIFFREPSVNLGVGSANGQIPHLSGSEFREFFGIQENSYLHYALSSGNFSTLAKEYGRVGGLDRMATVVNAIRSERPGALLFDGGDTYQGSYTCHHTAGQDMVNAMNLLKPDGMTFHWEFTLGSERLTDIIKNLPFDALGQNIFESEWDEPAELFKPYTFFERGGVKIAVIGQAFPYTPIANPRWMFAEYSFGIRERNMQKMVDEVTNAGAKLVVVLSHNGFDVDKKMAGNVSGIDIILSGHTHDALPSPIQVNRTFIIASGSNGKFVSRIDLEVNRRGLKQLHHKLIPILSDVIDPDPTMKKLIDSERAPYAEKLAEVIGYSKGLLFRRGNFNGTWDDVICDSIISERDSEIALSPGMRWGPSILPEQPITREDIWNVTAISYPNVYKIEMTGERLHEILEDIADNLFHPDPYYQQGGDMVRVGGIRYKIDKSKINGKRISDMTLVRTGKKIEPRRSYIVAGWASVIEGTQGPPIWEIVEKYIKTKRIVDANPYASVRF